MFVIKRNQVVVTALAVMIAAAGYLNFQESRSSEGKQTALQLTEEGDVTALVDYSALPDDTDETELDPITAETTGDGAAVYVSANGNGSAYFAEAKLNREQSSREGKGYFDSPRNAERGRNALCENARTGRSAHVSRRAILDEIRWERGARNEIIPAFGDDHILKIRCTAADQAQNAPWRKMRKHPRSQRRDTANRRLQPPFLPDSGARW